VGGSPSCKLRFARFSAGMKFQDWLSVAICQLILREASMAFLCLIVCLGKFVKMLLNIIIGVSMFRFIGKLR
jgi:hypothetical protein